MAKLIDWDDAYTNAAYIPDGDSYPSRWLKLAEAYRQSLGAHGRSKLNIAYGAGDRQKYDLFKPAGSANGLMIFIHGGYWLRFDRSYWSHLAQGAVDSGWSVAMPSYTLAPEASVAQITREVARAVTGIADEHAGPIVLAGHSAGGHLASRMLCRNSPLPASVQSRIGHVMSISGLHDLRPLLRTAMAAKLFRSDEEAAAESPALLEPATGARIACWVGTEERPEFLRQNDLLANIWTGLGADMQCRHASGRHHFNVIDDLSDAGSEMLRCLLSYSR
jgi:acetyl esterase/lipase